MSDEKLHEMTSDALRKLGRAELADELDGATPEPEPEPQDEGERFLDELRAAQKRGRVSIPGLLDE